MLMTRSDKFGKKYRRRPSGDLSLCATSCESLHPGWVSQLVCRWPSVPKIEDGSLLDFAQGAGIGVFSHLFSFYLHAGPLTTHFDGEVEAIHIALQQLAVRLPPIERARTPGKDKRKEIVFQWVPSHCGLWGNERADFLAKKGTGILQNFRRDLTLHSAKLEIKRIFRESFRLTASRVARDKPWSTLCKKYHGIPSSPRASAVAKFRLLTGHDCLCAHLFRFNLVTSPICVLCDTGQDMTAAHLDECSALNDLNCISVTHHSVSARTIRRRLQESGLSARRPLVGLPVTQNHRRLRHQWCDERRMWAAEWNEVVFTDESRICLQHHGGRIRVWRRRGKRMLNSCVMHRHTNRAPGIMIKPPAAIPDQLWQRVEGAWSAVPQEHVQSLFESMPRRVAAGISSSGDYSGY
ncbi:transposable element Tcb1 transposase [Trichonephila clavipes]|nr:transposable element Tcb1 transposase [Trichonephila clavipes]